MPHDLVLGRSALVGDTRLSWGPGAIGCSYREDPPGMAQHSHTALLSDTGSRSARQELASSRAHTQRCLWAPARVLRSKACFFYSYFFLIDPFQGQGRLAYRHPRAAAGRQFPPGRSRRGEMENSWWPPALCTFVMDLTTPYATRLF